MTDLRDRLADAFLLSHFNNNGPLHPEQPAWNPAHCTAEQYVAHIREHKSFALRRAYEMADWAIAAQEIINPSAQTVQERFRLTHDKLGRRHGVPD